MTPDNELRGALRLHFAAAPPMPDALLRDVLERVPETPQQRDVTPLSPKWRFQSMFSATKFVVAGVIVALFGGFLLSGVLTTQQGEELLPAVGATASESAEAEPPVVATHAEATNPPTTTTTSDLLPGARLTVEEVEPGVLRVVNDGVRDLRTRRAWPARTQTLLTGLDGSVWLVKKGQITEIGKERVLRHGAIRSDNIQLAGDGTSWLQIDDRLLSNGENGWRTQLQSRDGLVINFRVLSDGSVWALRDLGRPGLQDAGFMEADMENNHFLEIVRLRRGRGNNPKVLPQLPSRPPQDGEDGTLWGVSDDGNAWIVRNGVVSRYDGNAWGTVAKTQGPFQPHDMTLEVTPDGRVYANTNSRDGPVTLRLLEDGAWSAVPPPPPTGPAEPVDDRPVVTAVAPDGSYWRSVAAVTRCDGGHSCRVQESWFPDGVPVGMGAAGSCGGLARYDGTAWSRHLDGQCVLEVDFDTHGNAWVQAATPTLGEAARTATGMDVNALSFDIVDTYLITPEA